MAYDRYDRDERSRWSNNDRSDQSRHEERRGYRDERGFWDRASDEVASWFGDDEAERRRRDDTRREENIAGRDRRNREHGAFGRGWSSEADRRRDRNYDPDQSAFGASRSDQDFNYDRGAFNRGGSSERDYDPRSRRDMWRSDQDRDWDRSREGNPYTPMTGNYGGTRRHESDQFFAASGYGAGERALGDRDRDRDRSRTPYGRDEDRLTTYAGTRGDDREFDPNYRSWRDRQIGDLDRDYDDYSREHQARFEKDFTSWREKRQHKRGLLGQIREHMEVVGKDDDHVGKVDKTAGDRIILAKSDPDSGGAHHSLSCSDIDRIEGDKVILDCSADEARKRWRDESRKRALFERDDQGEMGPRNLNRSFEGTYR